MRDAVVDATVVAKANGPIERSTKGALKRCLPVIAKIAEQRWQCRYNAKLLAEYVAHVQEWRNDVVEAFFSLLDSGGATLCRSTLSRQDYAKASKIRWPSHDQHLLAAAIGGSDPCIFVTETTLSGLHSGVRRAFGVSVTRV